MVRNYIILTKKSIIEMIECELKLKYVYNCVIPEII